MRKPRFNVRNASNEMLCDLPYTLCIDYSTKALIIDCPRKGQKGRVQTVKIPGHFLEAVIEPALRRAWDAGYFARMEQGKVGRD